MSQPNLNERIQVDVSRPFLSTGLLRSPPLPHILVSASTQKNRSPSLADLTTPIPTLPNL